MQQYLRFGQVVRIHGHKCLQVENNKEQIRGMVAVKGFTNKDAKYMTFSCMKNCSFYRSTLFQILPWTALDPTSDKKEEAYLALTAEKRGQFVKFGEDVVFQHVDSHDYLSGSVRCSDGGLGAFKVQLSPELDNNIVFKLYPFRSFEKEGDKIKLESPIRIKNISNRCYVSTEQHDKGEVSEYNIVTTYSQKFTWSIHLHQDFNVQSDTIRTHDLIFLIHTRDNGYLTQMEDTPTIMLPRQQTGYPFFTSLWEIELLPVQQVSPYNETEDNGKLGTEGTYTLRQLLTGQYLEALQLGASSNYTSPNTISQGRERRGFKSYDLELDKREITITSAKGLTNIKDYLKDNGLIRIGGPKLNKDGEIHVGDMKVYDTKLLYRKEGQYLSAAIRLSEEESQHGFRIKRITEDSKDQVLFILSTYDVFDTFVALLSKSTEKFQEEVKSRDMEVIDTTLQKLIGFLKRCDISRIDEQLLPDRKLQFVCMDLQICSKLFAMIQRIGSKILDEVYKKTKGENNVLITIYSRAYTLVELIIRGNSITKLNVSEKYLDTILNHAIQNEEDAVHSTLNQILQENDEVVTKFLKKDNNQLLQRIIDVFKLKPPHQKFINIFRTSCVSGNLPVVANQKLILTCFLQPLDELASFKFRYETNGEDIISNIYIECAISKDYYQTRRLHQFFEESARLDLSQTANYFIGYLNLLADVCYGKNNEAKKYVERELTPTLRPSFEDTRSKWQIDEHKPKKVSALNALIAILYDKEMRMVKGFVSLQRAVLRLITYAYVQSADMNLLLRICRYRNLQPKEDMALQESTDIEVVMVFIRSELSESNKRENIQNTMKVYTMLQLLGSILTNGLCMHLHDSLLPQLLNMLCNEKKEILHHKEDNLTIEQEQHQFQLFKKQASTMSAGVQLEIKCKVLACELIQIILDFKFNSYISEMVSIYKERAIDSEVRKQEQRDQLQVWVEKIKTISDNSKAKINLVPLMVQLSIHRDIRLLNISLRILKRHFYLGRDIMQLFLSLSLYDRHRGQYVASQIDSRRRILNKLEQQSLLYISTDQNPYLEIIGFLVWLSEQVKTHKDGSKPNYEEEDGKYKSIFDHYAEHSRIDRFQQRLIKNMDLHPKMLKFLSLSKQPLESYSKHAKQVLKYVYRFLTLLVKKHPQAKRQIIKEIKQVRDHIKQDVQGLCKRHQAQSLQQNKALSQNNAKERDDCEGILFLTQLYTDNKILFIEEEMQSITVEMSQLLDMLPITSYYKCHILDFFRCLCYYQDKHIGVNKGRILAKLQDEKKNNIHLNLRVCETTVQQMLEEWHQVNEDMNQYEDEVVTSPQLSYVITLLNVLGDLIEGPHLVNIGKCRQIHSYPFVMGMLPMSGTCYPFKTHLRHYLNELYYSTNIEEDMCMDIMKKELPQLVNDLNRLIIALMKTTTQHTTQHPIRYLYFESYIYLYVEQICCTVYYLLNDSTKYAIVGTFLKELKKELAVSYSKGYFYWHYLILRLYERMRWMRAHYYEHAYIRGYFNSITNTIRKKLLQQFKVCAFRVFDRAQQGQHQSEGTELIRQKAQLNQVRVQALKKRSQHLLYKLIQANIGNYFMEEREQININFPLTFFLPYQETAAEDSRTRKQTYSKEVAEKLKKMLYPTKEQKRIDYHQIQLSKIKSALSMSQQFRGLMKKIQLQHCQSLYKIDHYSKQHYQFKGVFVSFQEYIKVFVQVVCEMPTMKQELPNDLRMFFFQVLFQYVSQHAEQGKHVEEWEFKDWEAHSEQIGAAQLFLKEAGVAKLLIYTLTNTHDLSLLLTVLQFGIAYLLGGNTQCQSSILDLLKSDPKNQVFLKFQLLIRTLGRKISSKMAGKTMENYGEDFFYPKMIDRYKLILHRYDSYSLQLKTMQKIRCTEEEEEVHFDQTTQCRLFCSIFKFLQLLCESNNFVFKQFMIEQTDTQDNKKNTSISMLTLTTFEIRRLCKNMSKGVNNIALYLLDFLNEIVTLPCIKNQMALCQTTFFQDLTYMQKEMKMKCVLILLNILQGNENELKRLLLSKLDCRFLLQLIRDNLSEKNIADVAALLRVIEQENPRILPTEISNAIEVLIVIIKLEQCQHADAFKQKKQLYLQQFHLKQLTVKLQQYILQIEVVSSCGRQYIYFPRHPILTKLSEKSRDRIMQEVSRSTQREKIKSLLAYKEEVIAEINHNYVVEQEQMLGMRISPQKIQQLHDFMFTIAYFIMLLWAVTANVLISMGQVQYYLSSLHEKIFLALALIQGSIAFIHLLLYTRYTSALTEFRVKRAQQRQQQKEQIMNKYMPSKQEQVSSGLISRNRLLTLLLDNRFTLLVWNDNEFLYSLILMITSIMGAFEIRYFLLYLLYYFMRHDILSNVFKAITYNIKQLFSVSALGLVFVSVFCLMFLGTYLDENSSCDTIHGCILDLFVSGNIGGSVQSFTINRFATDLIYFIFFGLLFGEIVRGIMIDTFAERRAAREAMRNDKKNRCYICGRDRGQLQKKGENFQLHISVRHFLWNYIYYIYCLEQKEETDYSGLQYEVRVCTQTSENQQSYIQWIPFAREETNQHAIKVQKATQITVKNTLTLKQYVNNVKNTLKNQ